MKLGKKDWPNQTDPQTDNAVLTELLKDTYERTHVLTAVIEYVAVNLEITYLRSDSSQSKSPYIDQFHYIYK